MLETPLFDREAMRRAAAKGKEPIVPVAASITALEVDAVGLKATGNGTVELEGEIPTALSAYFSVKGLPEFMDRAQEAGFLKQQQAMMAEGMAIHFGKKEDDGTLVFDIGVDGGMVTVNDSPVAPLPQ
jgi:hypothetical protein